MTRKSPPHLSRYAIAVLCASLLAPLLLLADSGITHGPFKLVSGPMNPPPDQTVTTTWSIDISNHNDVCDEKIIIQQKRGILNDPRNQDLSEMLRSGKAEFHGFRLTPTGANGNPLTNDMEDEKCDGCTRPPLTVFFDITTGENNQGCDFKGAEQKFEIRDIGLYCFTCCDGIDEFPAEPPTPYSPVLSINADGANAGGTGTIYGWVSRSIASKNIGQSSEVKAKKQGTCITGAPDNLDTFDEQRDSNGGLGADRGCYKFENVPFGNYIVRARADGSVFVDRNIAVASSAPVEVNICGGSSCPSNPACVP